MALAAVCLVLGLAACGGDDEVDAAAERTYVGTVDGTDAYIALVSDGKQVSGYLCDGTPKAVKVCRWLDNAELTGHNAELGERPHHFLVEARLGDDEAVGEVEPYPKAYSFTAEAASGEAGLYRANGEAVRAPPAGSGRPELRSFVEAGWIVLADGTQRGGVAISDPNTDLRPAPILDPTTLDVQLPRLGPTEASQVRDPNDL